MSSRPAPSECAQCGAAIPPHARACPECGADERTGWRETSIYDGIDLPDEAWEETDESAKKSPTELRRVNGIAWYWWCVAVLLLFFLGLSALSLLR